MREWSLMYIIFLMITILPLFIHKIGKNIWFIIRQINQHYRGFIKEKQVWEEKDK